MTVDVYGRPECTQCDWTKRHLDKRGVKYVYHDIDADPQARQAVEEAGILTLPMVVVTHHGRTDIWNGFKIDKIRGLSSND